MTTHTPTTSNDARALRTLPNNPEAEKALLGAIFADNRAFEKVSGFLRAEHFALTHHGRIFAAVAAVIERGQVADPITLKQYFEQDEVLAEIGGPAYLSELANSATTVINAGQYGELVADLYGRRTLIQTGEDLTAKAYDADVAVTAADILQEHMLGLGRVAPTCKHIGDASSPAARFKLVPFDDIPLSMESRYIVKGLIPREGLTVLWGPPKCGKSFWAFDAAMHVAQGLEYRGRPVVQGGVVYVALEGGAGYGARTAAYRQAKMAEDADPVPFHLIVDRLDLVAEAEALIGRIRQQMGDVPPILIVLDTLNRSLRGSESSDEDMTAYIQAADALREAFHCAILIIHHCGHDATRPRGHTSLAGAVDAQLAVKRDTSTGVFNVTVEWLKDGQEGEVIGNKLQVVDVGTDTDGDEITSCVVVEAEPARRRATRLTDKQRLAMDALHNLIIEHGRPAPDDTHYPPGARVADVFTWKEYLFTAGVLDKEATNPRTDFNRIKNQLTGKDAIGEWNGLVWAVRENADGP